MKVKTLRTNPNFLVIFRNEEQTKNRKKLLKARKLEEQKFQARYEEERQKKMSKKQTAAF